MNIYLLPEISQPKWAHRVAASCLLPSHEQNPTFTYTSNYFSSPPTITRSIHWLSYSWWHWNSSNITVQITTVPFTFTSTDIFFFQYLDTLLCYVMNIISSDRVPRNTFGWLFHPKLWLQPFLPPELLKPLNCLPSLLETPTLRANSDCPILTVPISAWAEAEFLLPAYELDASVTLLIFSWQLRQDFTSFWILSLLHATHWHYCFKTGGMAFTGELPWITSFR